MALLMARIDDRLIHGQVVVGCCEPLGARRLILANDSVASDALQTRIYSAAVPPGIEVEILPLRSAVARLAELERSGEIGDAVLVAGSCEEMLSLVRDGSPITRVTIGGLHHRPGTSEAWPGFFVDERDLECLRGLRRAGVALVVQSVPGAPAVEPDDQLGSGLQGSP